MYNDCTFIGNLGNDPEVRTAQNGGSTFTTFSVAVNKPGSDRDEKPLWVNATAFGKTGDFVGKYMKKGNRVLVQGALELQEYAAKDGTTKTSVKLLANRVVSLTEREGKAVGAGASATASAPAAKPISDEDIPF
jgi:single-strand DNA-binding protein